MTTKSNTRDMSTFREDWYVKLDAYIYWINRYSQRNQRKSRESKIHELISDIQQSNLSLIQRIREEVIDIPVGNPMIGRVPALRYKQRQALNTIEAEIKGE